MAETADSDPSEPSSVDALIRDIIALRRVLEARDAQRIIDRMRVSTFSLARRNIPAPLRELMREHRFEAPVRGNDLIYHWAKHVLGDKQWSAETTPAEYFEDARRAMGHPSVQLYVHAGPGGRDVAVAIAPTEEIVPRDRLGSNHGPHMLVVYSIVIDRIVSVHMTNSISLITSRSGTVWLRS